MGVSLELQTLAALELVAENVAPTIGQPFASVKLRAYGEGIAKAPFSDFMQFIAHGSAYDPLYCF
jgi:hypothetical protein